MMRYLTVRELLELHDRIIRASGGAKDLRDFSRVAHDLGLSVAKYLPDRLKQPEKFLP